MAARIAAIPDVADGCRANRAFLQRVVRELAEAGVRQFVDIGSGIPTVGNVHEVAQRHDPEARVVYVDSDPVAVAHSRAILAGNEKAVVVQGDLREPDAIVDHPAVRGAIDLERPVAVLMIAVLHFVPDDDDPRAAVTRIGARLAPGSFLVLSHASADGRPEMAGSHQQLYSRTPTPMTMRSRAEILQFFDGFELVEPGLVWLPLWHPDLPEDADQQPERTTGFAGVGRRR